MAAKGKFSEERLFRIRRLRKARRLFKQAPLFAFLWMQLEYPGYTYPEFLDDLRRRTPPKKKKGKSPLLRYGRYYRFQDMLFDYSQTKDPEYLRKAVRLRKHMTKPYRLLHKTKEGIVEYSFSPFLKIEIIEELTATLQTVKSREEASMLVEKIWDRQR